MLIKMLAILFVFIWIRATLPRLRYDMLMKFGWQGILPIALINILLLATVIVLHSAYGFVGYLMTAVLWAVIFLIGLYFFAKSKPSLLFTTNTRRSATIQLHGSAQPYRVVAENPGYGAQTLPPDARIGGFPSRPRSVRQTR